MPKHQRHHGGSRLASIDFRPFQSTSCVFHLLSCALIIQSVSLANFLQFICSRVSAFHCFCTNSVASRRVCVLACFCFLFLQYLSFPRGFFRSLGCSLQVVKGFVLLRMCFPRFLVFGFCCFTRIKWPFVASLSNVIVRALLLSGLRLLLASFLQDSGTVGRHRNICLLKEYHTDERFAKAAISVFTFISKPLLVKTWIRKGASYI